jgi:hypothetical protein
MLGHHLSPFEVEVLSATRIAPVKYFEHGTQEEDKAQPVRVLTAVTNHLYIRNISLRCWVCDYRALETWQG